MARTEAGAPSRIEQALERPLLYDTVQIVAGARWVDQRLQACLEGLHELAGGWLLDVGAGTGRAQRTVPADLRYCCSDTDRARLAMWRSRGGEGEALATDATRLAVRTGSMSVVLCRAILHHIPDDGLDALFAECARVLRPEGRLVVLDPTWARWRAPGRLLWVADRGAHPRTPARIAAAMGERFTLDSVEEFSVLHSYVLAVGRAA